MFVWLQVIARDVWSHGRIVRSVVRLCERLSAAEEADDDSEAGDWTEDILEGDSSGNISPQPSGSCSTSATPVTSKSSNQPRQPSKTVQFAKRLEKRWQYLYLSCLEQQCLLDQVASSNKQQVSRPTLVPIFNPRIPQEAASQ